MTEEGTEASEKLHIPPHVGTCAHMHTHTHRFARLQSS